MPRTSTLTAPAAAASATTAVLFVDHEVELGGAERSLLELLRALDRTRWQPHLACPGSGPLPQAARELGVPVHEVPLSLHGALAKVRGLPRAARALRELVARQQIGVVHANTLIAGYCALWAARAARVPCVWHVRDMTYPWLGRAAARRADACIANSAATAATIGGRGVEVVHNGVDARFFDEPDRRAELRAELGLPAAEVVVAMVGRLDPWKGHRLLLDAIARMAHRATFAVVGDVAFASGRTRHGGYRAELEERARALGIADRVKFLGQRDDVARVLAGCDLLVHPSVEPEPFGRAIAEALAAGLPVVAADHGGVPELVAHDHTGLLVAPRDAGVLAAALDRAVADPELRQRLGNAARATALARFTARGHAQAVERVYSGLAGGPG
jgi:glycosyltransferase involved in cell wall biosynthesis